MEHRSYERIDTKIDSKFNQIIGANVATVVTITAVVLAAVRF